MGYSDGRITAPVSIYDVQRAIGETSPDLGTLCQSTKINKWAKYKPIKYASFTPLNDGQRLFENWGITDIPTWTRIEYMSIFLFSDNRASLANTYWPECDYEKGSLSLEYWGYGHPNGGNQSPFRLTDFVQYPLAQDAINRLGYFRHAEAPIRNMEDININISPLGAMRITFPMGALADETLKLSDLTWPDASNTPLSGMYFGVMARKVNGGTVYVGTQRYVSEGVTVDVNVEDALQMGWWVDVQPFIVQDDFEGDWIIFPIISSIAGWFGSINYFMSNANSNTGKFIALLPYHFQPVSVTITYATVEIVSATGYFTTDASKHKIVHIELTVHNPMEDGYTLNYGATVHIYNSQYQEQSVGGNQKNNLNINGNSTTVVNFDIRVDYLSRFDSGYFDAQTTISAIYNYRFTRNSTWNMTEIRTIPPTPTPYLER